MTLKVFRSSIFHFLENENTPEYFEDGILIVKNGYIVEVGHAKKLLKTIPKKIKIQHFKNHLIMPGFVDTHIHFPQIDVIASYGEQLLTWLDKYTFPAERKFKNKNYAKQVAKIFIQELLKHGTTTAMVFATSHPQSVDALFEEAIKKQMRIISGINMMDRNVPEEFIHTPEYYYQQNKKLINKWHEKDRLLYAVTPRFAVSCSDQLLTVAKRLLDEFPTVYFQTHLAENKAEIEWVKKLYPQAKNYLDVYEQFKLTTNRSVFAHGVYLEQDDFNKLAEKNSSIAFCPSSNFFLGSGLFPIYYAEKAKVKLGMGSDVGGGNYFSMLQVMNDAYKVVHLQGAPLSPLKSFYLLTLGGAKALNLENKIGNFLPGKEADFVVLNPNATTLLKYRMQQTKRLEEKLFLLLMLGDERVVAQTFILGCSAHRSSI